MASIVSKFSSYQRLKQEVIFEEDVHRNKSKKERFSEIIRRSSSSIRLRSKWFSKLKLRRKLRVIKLGGYFRRFFRIRRSKKLKVARLAWANKVYKRLKEGQSHFGDLFAGNYLFMQVTPGSFKANNNSNNNYYVSSHQINKNNYSINSDNNNKISRFPSSYCNNNYVCS